MTYNTNDMSLALARAQRDLGCRYTLGFYFEGTKFDHAHRVAVNLLRPGLRAMHPDKYAFRSESRRRTSRVSAAFQAPDMFFTGVVRTHVFLLQPRSKKSWEALLAVDFPVEFDDERRFAGDFGLVVHSGGRVLHRFHRQVSLKQKEGSELKQRQFMFLEPALIGPGDYKISVVMSPRGTEGGTGSRPDATRAHVEIPPVTKRDLMLMPPILGRPRSDNVVVRGDHRGDAYSAGTAAELDIVASKGSFEPMMIQRVGDDDPMLTRNKACIVRTKRLPPGEVVRVIKGEDGAPSVELGVIPLELEAGDKVSCQNIFETVPADWIDDGRYLFEASVTTRDPDPLQESLPFAVEPEDPAAEEPTQRPFPP